TEAIEVGGFFFNFSVESGGNNFYCNFMKSFFLCHHRTRTKNRRSKIFKKAQCQSLHLSVFYQINLFYELSMVVDALKIFPNESYFFNTPELFSSDLETL